MSRHSKRESGANPEQTRCCKALSKLMCHLLDETTAPLMLLGVGRRYLSELSQKTCHDHYFYQSATWTLQYDTLLARGCSHALDTRRLGLMLLVCGSLSRQVVES